MGLKEEFEKYPLWALISAKRQELFETYPDLVGVYANHDGVLFSFAYPHDAQPRPVMDDRIPGLQKFFPDNKIYIDTDPVIPEELPLHRLLGLHDDDLMAIMGEGTCYRWRLGRDEQGSYISFMVQKGNEAIKRRLEELFPGVELAFDEADGITFVRGKNGRAAAPVPAPAAPVLSTPAHT